MNKEELSSILEVNSKKDIKRYRLILKVLYKLGVISEIRYNLKLEYLNILEEMLEEKQLVKK